MQRSSSTQPAEDIGNEIIETAAIATAPAPTPATESVSEIELGELLASHGFTPKLSARLVELASAPTHVKRPVDRLAIALGAQFNFFALEEARQQPILLCGLPGAGTSTLATKLAARYDDSEILVISAGAHDAQKTALLTENLEALDLPLTHVADATALKRAVDAAAGRKIIIDVAAQSSFNAAQVKDFLAASGAAGMLTISAESTIEDTTSVANAASDLGVTRMIVTGLDVGRYLGAALSAADATKLALVSASITPHFGFGLRAFTPENIARRLMSGGHPERWRVAPI
jgi:signal recognition particle GTPase